MKRTFNKFIVIALGVIAISCAKEKALTDSTDLVEPITINFTIGLPEIEGSSTKASFSDDLGITWEAGDQIWYTGNPDATNLATLTAGNITENGHKASFSVTTSSTTGVLKYNWSTRNIAEWDYGSLQTNYVNQTNFDSSTASLTANTTLEFTQSEAGVMNKRFLFLHSATSNQSYTVDEGSIAVADVKMKIVGSIFRIIPYTTSYNTEEIQSVEFTLNGSANFGGIAIYNYGSGDYSTANNWDYFYKRVKVNLGTPFALTTATSKENSKGIYFAAEKTASTIEGGYTITIKTDQATYTYVSAKSLTIEDNKVKNFPILLDAAHRVGNDEWPVDAYFYPTSKEKFSGMVDAIESYVIAGDRKSATVTFKDKNEHAGALYFDGGFNDILDNKVTHDSHDAGLAGFDNAPGYIFNFVMYQNTTGAERTMDVVFHAEAASNGATGYFTLHFVQPGVNPPSFAVDKTSQEVAASATSATINVLAESVSWTASVISGDASISPTSGSNNGSITVTFDENLSSSTANEYVVRVATDAAVPTKTYDVTITQAKKASITLPDYQDAENLWLPIDTDAAAHIYDKAGQFGDVDFTAKTLSTSGVYSCALTNGDTGAGDGDGKFAIMPSVGNEITLASGSDYAFSATVRMSTGNTGAFSQLGLYGYNTSTSSWEVISICAKRAFNGTPYTYTITGSAAATYSNIQVVAFVRASGGNNVVEVKDIIFAKN